MINDLLNEYSTQIAVVIGVAIGWLLKKLFGWLDGYVAGTANTWDDAVLAKFKEAVKEVLAEVESEKQADTVKTTKISQ